MAADAEQYKERIDGYVSKVLSIPPVLDYKDASISKNIFYPGIIEICVFDNTRNAWSFMLSDNFLMLIKNRPNKETANPVCDTVEALTNARNIVKCFTSESECLILDKSKIKPPKFDDLIPSWEFTWNRYWSGYQYNYEWITVKLYPDGSFFSYKNTCMSDTCETNSKLPTSEVMDCAIIGLEKAWGWFVKVKKIDAVITGPYIINRNDFTDYIHVRDRWPKYNPETRLAWLLDASVQFYHPIFTPLMKLVDKFSEPSVQKGRTRFWLYIDAENGELIGGFPGD